MKDLIKQIRGCASMSQQELADAVGVTFASVNRWENGHSVPNTLAQKKLYELCKEKNIPLAKLVIERISQEAESLEQNENRLILYHGSKSGIVGNIAPVSRQKCDFGQGFYMGTQPQQPLTLICDYERSVFYIVSLELTGLRTITVPPTLEWAMLIAYYRGKMDMIKGSQLYNRYAEMLRDYDVVNGCIADDRMFFVLDNFFLGNITDSALISSLSALQLGQQVVCITQKACDRVKIEKEIPLSFLERQCMQDISEKNRKNGVSLANRICKEHRREGRYFDEILEEEQT